MKHFDMQCLIIGNLQVLKHARYLEHLQSFTHLPRVQKAKPTCDAQGYNDATKFQMGVAWSWSLPRLHQSSMTLFTNLPSPEMAAATLAEKLPATILPLG